MSIIGLFAILVLICIGVWIIQQAGFPQPITWGLYGLLLVIVIVIALNVSGVSLGHI
jgi:hypothetical protein